MGVRWDVHQRINFVKRIRAKKSIPRPCCTKNESGLLAVATNEGSIFGEHITELMPTNPATIMLFANPQGHALLRGFILLSHLYPNTGKQTWSDQTFQ